MPALSAANLYVFEYSGRRARLVSGPLTARQARELARPNRFAVPATEAEKYGVKTKQLRLL